MAKRARHAALAHTVCRTSDRAPPALLHLVLQEADALVGEGSTPTLGNAFMDLLKKATLQAGRLGARNACCGAAAGRGGLCRCSQLQGPAKRCLSAALCWLWHRGTCVHTPATSAKHLASPPASLRACLQGGLKRQPYGILKDLSGVLRPGTITLLLGPPGAGKTVFLQVWGL